MIRRGFKVTRTLRKKIRDLAARVGCPLNFHRAPGITWNGKDLACKGLDASTIIHDIAHYAVASRKDRKTIDFGLGASPDSDEYDKEGNYIKFPRNYHDTQPKEIEASALGIYWEKQFGLPWKSTYKYHNWDSDDIDEAWKDLRRKIKKVGI